MLKHVANRINPSRPTQPPCDVQNARSQVPRGRHPSKGARRRLLRFELLEDRRLLAFTPGLVGTEVSFLGSSGHDTLALQDDAGLLAYDIGGGFTTDFGGAAIATNQVTSITIDGKNNNEAVFFIL